MATFKGCNFCQHFRITTCAAFPQGIPLPIVAGEVDHLVPRPELGQDNDVVYEEVRDADNWMARGAPEEDRTA